MESKNDSWTGAWVADKITSHSEVLSAATIDSCNVQIQRVKQPDTVIHTMSRPHVTKADLEARVIAVGVRFVANVSRKSYIAGSALEQARRGGFGIGSMADLNRSLNYTDPAEYVPREVEFITRGLRQHTHVASVVLSGSEELYVTRKSLKPVTLAFTPEYDLSADQLRQMIDRAPPFTLLLASNPNAGPSHEAYEVAKNAGIEIASWSELLGGLQYKWN